MDINMIKDSIEKAIDKGSRISITYSKDGETTTIIQLTGVSYSAKYGKDYITGLSGEKELTLKIDRIVNVEFEWIEINNGDICSINDGIYLIRKLDITDPEQNYFERYKKECMLALFSTNTFDAINTLAQSYKIVYN